jgi:Ni,Fe-hydrogenase III component G
VHNVRSQLIRAARDQVPELYGLEAVTADDERRQVLQGLLDGNAYVFRAADRALLPDVRHRHHS